MTSTRLIPKPTVDLNDFLELAWDEVWLVRKQVTAAPEQRIPFELVFTASDSPTRINYIEDFVVGFPYIQVEGEAHDEVVETMRENLDIFSDDELFAQWDGARDTDDRVRAVLCLGVAAPATVSPEFHVRIQAALAHQAAPVRMAGVLAVAYRGWPEFAMTLARMAAAEPNAEIRANIENLLARSPYRDSVQ